MKTTELLESDYYNKRLLCQVCHTDIPENKKVHLCDKCDRQVRWEHATMQKQYYKHAKWWTKLVFTDPDIRYGSK